MAASFASRHHSSQSAALSKRRSPVHAVAGFEKFPAVIHALFRIFRRWLKQLKLNGIAPMLHIFSSDTCHNASARKRKFPRVAAEAYFTIFVTVINMTSAPSEKAMLRETPSFCIIVPALTEFPSVQHEKIAFRLKPGDVLHHYPVASAVGIVADVVDGSGLRLRNERRHIVQGPCREIFRTGVAYLYRRADCKQRHKNKDGAHNEYCKLSGDYLVWRSFQREYYLSGIQNQNDYNSERAGKSIRFTKMLQRHAGIIRNAGLQPAAQCVIIKCETTDGKRLLR